MIVGQRVGHHLVERQAVVAERLHENRAHAGKPKALAHRMSTHSEPKADPIDRQAGAAVVQPRERIKLVGWMHRQPTGVLGKADLSGVLVLDETAGDRRGLCQFLARSQQAQRGKPAATRDHVIAAGSLPAFPRGGHLQRIEQTLAGYQRGQFINTLVPAGLPDVDGRNVQLAERDRNNLHDGHWGTSLNDARTIPDSAIIACIFCAST